LRPAVFLDRDGTLLVERGGPPVCPEEVDLNPGVADGLLTLGAAGFALVVVTNQSGIARGHYDEGTYRDVTSQMEDLLAASNVALDGVYHCPHHPDSACDCRKPKPGLLLKAAQELEIDLGRSWCVGDATRDLEAGLAAGCRVVLVLTGKGESERTAAGSLGAHVAPDLEAAARVIVEEGVDG
jgi:D-glycero-D-manno-heptose 1,7-bisphosphate phosphatase